jgi:hypothetical protein
MPIQDCPLCGGPAAFSGHDYGRRKGYSCQNCTEFIVTLSAEARLKESMQSWKDAIIEKTKTTPGGQILLIYVPDQHQPDALNKKVLSAVYQPRES